MPPRYLTIRPNPMDCRTSGFCGPWQNSSSLSRCSSKRVSLSSLQTLATSATGSLSPSSSATRHTTTPRTSPLPSYLCPPSAHSSTSLYSHHITQARNRSLLPHRSPRRLPHPTHRPLHRPSPRLARRSSLYARSHRVLGDRDGRSGVECGGGRDYVPRLRYFRLDAADFFGCDCVEVRSCLFLPDTLGHDRTRLIVFCV